MESWIRVKQWILFNIYDNKNIVNNQYKFDNHIEFEMINDIDEKHIEFMKKIDHWLVQDYGLNSVGIKIVKKWVKSMAQDIEGLKRIRDWMLRELFPSMKANRTSFSTWQYGCPDLIPGLRSVAFWETRPELEPILSIIHSYIPEIISEFEASKSEKVFQPYRAPNWANPDRIADDGIGSMGHAYGDWNICYLFLHNVDFESNCKLFPKTVEMIRSLPRYYRHALFTVVSPETLISKHNGPTNKKLRIHVPVSIPPGGVSGIRVGDETRVFEIGKCVVFDDSYEHEAWNLHPSMERVCLILDIWHPDLSDREVTLLKFLEKGKMELARRSCDYASKKQDDGESGDNFYKVLDHTRSLAKSLE